MPFEHHPRPRILAIIPLLVFCCIEVIASDFEYFATIGELSVSGTPESVVVDEDLAFLTVQGEGLVIVDISDPTTPTRLGTYAGGGALPPSGFPIRSGMTENGTVSHFVIPAKAGIQLNQVFFTRLLKMFSTRRLFPANSASSLPITRGPLPASETL